MRHLALTLVLLTTACVSRDSLPGEQSKRDASAADYAGGHAPQDAGEDAMAASDGSAPDGFDAGADVDAGEDAGAGDAEPADSGDDSAVDEDAETPIDWGDELAWTLERSPIDYDGVFESPRALLTLARMDGQTAQLEIELLADESSVTFASGVHFANARTALSMPGTTGSIDLVYGTSSLRRVAAITASEVPTDSEVSRAVATGYVKPDGKVWIRWDFYVTP